MTEWFKCCEVHPPKEREVLLWDGEYMGFGTFWCINNGSYDFDSEKTFCNATHWAEAPQPPKEKCDFEKSWDEFSKETSERLHEDLMRHYNLPKVNTEHCWNCSEVPEKIFHVPYGYNMSVVIVHICEKCFTHLGELNWQERDIITKKTIEKELSTRNDQTKT